MKCFVPVSIFFATICLIVSSCSTIKLTRIEEDTYTVTQRDTTIVTNVAYPPGTREKLEPTVQGSNPNNNGAIFPSTRVTQIQRDKDQIDSVVTREYPNFIRYGLFESAGLLLTSDTRKLGFGPFGIFFDLEELLGDLDTTKTNIFSGAMYRFMPTEYRLRWFNDDPDWTIGTYAFEWIIPRAIVADIPATPNSPEVKGSNKSVMSFLPLYLRKRFYLRREIPYVAITPTVGLGYLGSQYANLGVTADIGSIGGFNMRAYAGYIMNFSPSETGSNFPYFGFGTSVLDFLNLQEETEEEFKYMKHSAWNIGLVQLSVLNTSSETAMFQNPDSSGLPTNTLFRGLHLKLAPTTVALPFLNYQLYAGTSLLSFTGTGFGEWSYAILPIRIGFWQPLIKDEMTVEPFFEFGYAPNTSYNIGTKLNFRLNENTTLGLTAGYITASGILEGKNAASEFILDRLGAPTDFSRFYMGISVGIFDKIFSRSELRYFK
jgi:hypothetical protein